MIDESMLLNSTYTIENFPEIDNTIESKLIICYKLLIMFYQNVNIFNSHYTMINIYYVYMCVLYCIYLYTI